MNANGAAEPPRPKIRFARCDESEYRSLMNSLSEPGVIMQDPAWAKFIQISQNAEPVFLKIFVDDRICGTFLGAIVRKFGIRILGSPMEGWTTPYMGFRLGLNVDRNLLIGELQQYGFSALKVDYIEIVDNEIVSKSNAKYGSDQLYSFTYLVDLDRSEEELFGSFSSACRRCIRKAKKCGIIIEFAKETDKDFVDEYYAMLQDVFAKQGLVPTYSKQRVYDLISSFADSNSILLVRALHPETRIIIAAGIFPAGGRTMHFWGGASWRGFQCFRPNELIMWSAMLYWKSRGITTFDLGGGSEYKLKYSPEEVLYPRFCLARWKILIEFRKLAKWLWRRSAVVLGRLRSCGKSSPD